MSLLRLFDRRDYNLENPGVPLSAASISGWNGLLGNGRNVAGVNVTETTALGASAVWRPVTLISGVAASQPINVYRANSFDPRPCNILDNPHPDLTPYEFWRLSYVHRLLWGNSYAQKIRNGAGQLQWLYPITPNRVQVGRIKPSAGNPGGKVFRVRGDDGQLHVRTSNDILHIPGLGYDGITGCSPIRMMARSVGVGMAAEEFMAKLFSNGTLLSGVLQTEQRLDEDDADALKKRWREKLAGLNNAHDVAVLDSGLKFEPMSMPNTDAQVLETRTFGVTELSRFFGVPPFLMFEMQKSTSWGTGLEQQATGFVVFDLHPNWLAPTEGRITKELTPPGTTARYDVSGIMRGDSKSRSQFYTAMWNVGALNSNEIRAAENKAPYDGGDEYHTPLNMAPAPTEADTEPVTDAGKGDEDDDDN